MCFIDYINYIKVSLLTSSSSFFLHLLSSIISKSLILFSMAKQNIFIFTILSLFKYSILLIMDWMLIFSLGLFLWASSYLVIANYALFALSLLEYMKCILITVTYHQCCMYQFATCLSVLDCLVQDWILCLHILQAASDWKLWQSIWRLQVHFPRGFPWRSSWVPWKIEVPRERIRVSISKVLYI